MNLERFVARVLLPGALALAFCLPAQAEVVNGSFEAGLDGWNTVIPPGASAGSSTDWQATNSNPVFVFEPTDGNRFARLNTDGAGSETIVAQSITGAEDEFIEFDIFFDANDDLANDFGGARLSRGVDPDIVLWEAFGFDLDGGLGNTPWVHVRQWFGTQGNNPGEIAPGTYMLEFFVQNTGSSGNDPTLGVDAVTLLPEPASVLLLSLGLLGLTKRRRA